MNIRKILVLLESSAKYKKTIDKDDFPYLIKILNTVVLSKFFIIRNNCLKKSLLFYYWFLKYNLKGFGINFGVSKENKKLIGHCWITRYGKAYFESEESLKKYTITYRSK